MKSEFGKNSEKKQEICNPEWIEMVAAVKSEVSEWT
jgi:hypothetical protein